MTTLEIRDLHVSVEVEDGAKEILRGVDLTINSGETHAIMGPNGSGKSTLAYSIAGHPKYKVTGGTVTLDGENVLAMKVDERARAGLFLAMQYPVEVPGVSVSNFLRTAVTAIQGEAPKLRTWVKDLNAAFDNLAISVNGFGVSDSTTGVLALDDSDERFQERTATMREVPYLPEQEMHRYVLHSLRPVH